MTGTPAFFAPEMCGDDKTGFKMYSGRAADVWALGVCLYMWVFLRLPFEAPTVYMLMQEIGHSPLELPAGDARSLELLELCRGLLAKKPVQRLRIKDLRRDNWMTDGQKEPLPVPQHERHSTVHKGELQDILHRGMVQLRGVKHLEATRTSNPDGDASNRFVDNVTQVEIAPRKSQTTRPDPRGPGMLKRAGA